MSTKSETKPVDPAACDEWFADEGGFEAAYKKLLAFAGMQLSLRVGDSGAPVALRQLDAEDVVNAAFERLFADGLEPGKTAYYQLRNHVDNSVRSVAKSKGESRLVRPDRWGELPEGYHNQVNPSEPSITERMAIADDIAFCKTVLSCVAAKCKDDLEVTKLCEAVVAGFRDHADLREYAELELPQYDAAFKRLRRQFSHCSREAKKGLRA